MSTWAVSCYFNTKKSRLRYLNYQAFFKALQVPLLTVEWSIGGQYELDIQDADRLVQVSGGDLLWQKERLLNLALDHLPEDCVNVVWLDCDIVFNASDWVENFEHKLNDAHLVQLFSQVRHPVLPPSGELSFGEDTAEVVLERDSLAYRYLTQGKASLREVLPSNAVKKKQATYAEAKDLEQFERLRLAGRPSAGHGWGMRRDHLERLGLYDGMAFGTGDMAMALAGIGFQALYADGYLLSDAHREHYLHWAEPFHQHIAGRVASIPGSVNHLYHGNFRERQYSERLRMMAVYGFDPARDLSLTSQGLWQWHGDAASRYEGYMHSYFSGRSEDSPDRVTGV